MAHGKRRTTVILLTHPRGLPGISVTVSSGGVPADGAAAYETVLYAACQRALRPGGVLAVIASRPALGQIPDLSHAVACARAAGLVYAQHIVLIHAAVDGGRLRPFPGQHAAASCSREGPPDARIHADLLVLIKAAYGAVSRWVSRCLSASWPGSSARPPGAACR